MCESERERERERESKTLDNILVSLNEWVTSSALGGILCSEHLLERKRKREGECVCVCLIGRKIIASNEGVGPS